MSEGEHPLPAIRSRSLFETFKGHVRSSSVTPVQPISVRQHLTRSGSSPQIPSPSIHSSPIKRNEDDLVVTTLPDPRTPRDPPTKSDEPTSAATSDPDNEVTKLSNKLISAINHQTQLDDALSRMRQELEQAQQRLQDADTKIEHHNTLVQNGDLVPREKLSALQSQHDTELQSERESIARITDEKKAIERELENLTSALFEQANTMVAEARRETDTMEKKNEQLKQQLSDTETLLATHQEQLTVLKQVMEEIRNEQNCVGTVATSITNTNGTQSSTTGGLAQGSELHTLAPAVPGVHDLQPNTPTSFNYLISPVLRTDHPQYDDFKALLDLAKAYRTDSVPSRIGSGSYKGLLIPGVNAPFPLSSSTNSSTTHNSSGTTALPSNQSTSSNGPGESASNLPLKETKFYKRVLTEDLEPTLRLDTAPGLSWLARRSVISSMSEGSLIVEPMPTIAITRNKLYPCALCGEIRSAENLTRTHRFRFSDSDGAQRYPLCPYCLARVRSCCDYLNFLRMVKDGFWRTEGEDAERGAWEECVRLREAMFWARIGGGVVPVYVQAENRRSSNDNYQTTKEPMSAPARFDIGDEQPQNGNKASFEGNHVSKTLPSNSPGKLSPSRAADRGIVTAPNTPRTADRQTTLSPETLQKEVAQTRLRSISLEDKDARPATAAGDPSDAGLSMPGGF